MKNVKIFYYEEEQVKFDYVVVGPTGCGTLSSYTETINARTGTALGSEPTAGESFKFVGWYLDEACSVPVNVAPKVDGTVDADINKFTPSMQNVEGVQIYVSDVFYAKFEYNVADLKITKSVVDAKNAPLADTTNFSYTVTFTDVASKTYVIYDADNNQVSTGTVANNGTVTFNSTQYAVIKDVVITSGWTVTENEVPTGYRFKSATGGAVNGMTVSGTMAENGSTAAFTNYKTSTLTIKKEVTGLYANNTQGFAFTVALPSNTYSYTLNGNAVAAGLDTTSGTAALNLKHNDIVVITDAPVNAPFTVTEMENTNYTASVKVDNATTATVSTTTTGSVDADGTAVTFINTYKTGTLTINKIPGVNTTFEEGETFVFVVDGTSDDAADKVQNLRVTVAADKDGNVASVILKDMPYGSYTVSEDTTWSQRYTPSFVYNVTSVTLDSDDSTGEVTIKNTISNNKWVDSNAYAENVFQSVSSSQN